jgi:hypothetical protein
VFFLPEIPVRPGYPGSETRPGKRGFAPLLGAAERISAACLSEKVVARLFQHQN